MSPKKLRLFPLSLSHLLALVAISSGFIGYFYLQKYESQTKVSLPIPVRDLPAYHQIQTSDLMQQNYPARTVSKTTLRKSTEILGRYTLTTIPREKPLSQKQLSSKLEPQRAKLLADTVAIGIPATPALVLGGNLQAGDVVDITLISEATKELPSPKSLKFDNILVLDIKTVSSNKSSQNTPSEFVVVIAMPRQRQQEFAINSAGRELLLSRKL